MIRVQKYLAHKMVIKSNNVLQKTFINIYTPQKFGLKKFLKNAF